MLMRAANEVKIEIKLKAVSPLLIREGRYGQEEKNRWVDELPDPDEKKAKKDSMPVAIPVSRNSISDIKARIMKDDSQAAVNALELYIPGSSMRGAWRAHLERNLRGMTAINQPEIVCDPLNDKSGEPSNGCSQFWVDKRKQADEAEDREEVREEEIPYLRSCPICKLFGHTAQGARISISDGERIKGPGRIVVRDHVAINRRTGAVESPFRFFGLQDAAFQVQVGIRNFELSQMALLAWLLEDLGAENVPLGACKNKGYGRVKAEVQSITLVYFGLPNPGNWLFGVAEHPVHGEWFAQRYGLLPGKAPDISVATWAEPAPWRRQTVFTGAEAVKSFLGVCRNIPYDTSQIPSLLQIRQRAAR